MWSPKSALRGLLPGRVLSTTSGPKKVSHAASGWLERCPAHPGKWPKWRVPTAPCVLTARSQCGAAACRYRQPMAGPACKSGRKLQAIFWPKWGSRQMQPGAAFTTVRSTTPISTSRCSGPCPMGRCGTSRGPQSGVSRRAPYWRPATSWPVMTAPQSQKQRPQGQKLKFQTAKDNQ